MTYKEVHELLEKADAYEMLSKIELLHLVWWEMFNSTKFNRFLALLKMGFHAKYAYTVVKGGLNDQTR